MKVWNCVGIISMLYWVDQVVKSCPFWNYFGTSCSLGVEPCQTPDLMYHCGKSRCQLNATCFSRWNYLRILKLTWFGFITDCTGWKDLLFLIILYVIIFSAFSVTITSVLATKDGLSSWICIIMPFVQCNNTPYTDSGLWSPLYHTNVTGKDGCMTLET